METLALEREKNTPFVDHLVHLVHSVIICYDEHKRRCDGRGGPKVNSVCYVTVWTGVLSHGVWRKPWMAEQKKSLRPGRRRFYMATEQPL